MKIEMQTVSSLQKIFPSEEIALFENSGSMLKNERFGFQIALRSDENVRGATLKISGINKKNYRLRKVGLVPGYFTGYRKLDYSYGKSATLFPDVLVDDNGKKVNLSINLWTVFWVTCENIPTGSHKIKIALFNNEEKVADTTYRLNVLDGELSTDEVLYTNWMHYDSIANCHRAKVFSDRFYKFLGKYVDNAVSHGVNILYTPLFTPPLDTKIGGERLTVQLVDVKKHGDDYEISFEKLQKFVNFALAHGVKYFEFSHLFTQWGAKAAPKITDDKGNKLFGWETLSDSPEYLSFLDKVLTKLNDFIDKNDLVGRCFCHVSDEPHIDHIDYYKKLSDFVRLRLTNAKLIDALSNFDFYERKLVDIPVVITDGATPYLENAKDFWVYYCCGPYDENHSNRFFDFPSERTRVLGIQLYINNIRGFLHWGYNFYNCQYSEYAIDPYKVTDGGGAFPSGDSFIVYPSEKGVYDSLRHEVFYDGLQDYRALRKLEEIKGREFTVSLLKKNGFMQDFVTYPHSPSALVALRKEVNDLIAKDKA